MDEPHAQFQVLKQEKTTTILSDGTMGDEWKITYRTPSGTVSFIRIPASDYSSENVAALIQYELGHVEAIHALGQQTAG